MREKSIGKYPQRLIYLVTDEVSRTSQSHVARQSGAGLNTVQRILKGQGEPTISVLQKFANYYKEIFVIEVKPESC